MRKNRSIILFVLILAACRGAQAPGAASAEAAPVSATRWTAKTELFLEYPALVAGKVSRFSVHLTELESFKPLTAGRVTVELLSPDGIVETFRAESPSRPGIFGLDVKPAAAGARQMKIRFESASWGDIHDVGTVTIRSENEPPAIEAEADLAEAIPYLKEQQWTLAFATAVVAERAIRPSLTVPGEVLPRTGGDVEVIVPVAGRLAAGDVWPALGSPVRAGSILARVIPRSGTPADAAGLESALREAETAMDLARRDRERVERLAQAGAVPGKRMDEAKASEAVAEARLRAAKARLGQLEFSRDGRQDALHAGGAFILRAPIDGVLAASNGTPGAAVEEGQRLFRIVAVDTVYVQAALPEEEIGRLADLAGGEMAVSGRTEPLPLGRIISRGRVVDPASRTIPVVFEARNGDGRLAVGQAVLIRLFSAQAALSPAIPESAVVDDAGRPVVFVQAAGESFLRRPVRLGGREGGIVQVLEGLKAGERVVTAGAHQIRLSALSPQVPAHGHVH